jgi:hypothetical protein
MANHVRRQIRDAAATALAGLTTTGARVYPSRTYPLQDANLPALRIYTNEETVEMSSMGGANRLVQRTLNLLVEGCAKVNDTLDDTLDDIIKEVETAIAANQTLGGAKWVQLAGIEIEMEGEGEKETGVARMTFQCEYITELDTPDVAL